MVSIVADTNVFVSGLFWPGKPHRLLSLAVEKKITLCSSLPLISEFKEIVQRDFQVGLQEADLMVDVLLQSVQLFQTADCVKLVKEDPDDDKVLECALACKADYVVSGDRHLLALKEFSGIPILTVNQLLNRLKEVHGIE
jgi:putative PIN family toxin of toxin-antitoxin system